jgi:TonB family protein
MRKPSNTSRILVAILALAVLGGARAGDEETDTRHLTDSSTDRVPAITAFPKYPSIARRDRIEGEAVVCFMIDVDGAIRRPSIRSSTHKIFEKPAMGAIRRSSFEPLAPGETLSKSRTCRTYRFRLDSITARNDSDPQGSASF